MFADFNRLFKFRLTFIVVLSAVAGYIIAALYTDSPIDSNIVSLIFGGFFVTSSSNALNQLIEYQLDARMKRTELRPLVTGSLKASFVIFMCVILGIAGVLLLTYAFNWLAGFIALASLVLYAFAYTPLKPFSNLAVFVGAFPGALPPLIGYVAITNAIDFPAILLFSSQFFWQFPHFWAIAWLAHEDYLKAGISLLPSHKKDRKSATQILLYTFFLVPISLLPFSIQIAGMIYATSAVVLGIGFLYTAISLFSNLDNNNARKVLFYSFAYLPLLQLAWIIDQL